MLLVECKNTYLEPQVNKSMEGVVKGMGSALKVVFLTEFLRIERNWIKHPYFVFTKEYGHCAYKQDYGRF